MGHGSPQPPFPSGHLTGCVRAVDAACPDAHACRARALGPDLCAQPTPGPSTTAGRERVCAPGGTVLQGPGCNGFRVFQGRPGPKGAPGVTGPAGEPVSPCGRRRTGQARVSLRCSRSQPLHGFCRLHPSPQASRHTAVPRKPVPGVDRPRSPSRRRSPSRAEAGAVCLHVGPRGAGGWAGPANTVSGTRSLGRLSPDPWRPPSGPRAAPSPGPAGSPAPDGPECGARQAGPQARPPSLSFPSCETGPPQGPGGVWAQVEGLAGAQVACGTEP